MTHGYAVSNTVCLLLFTNTDIFDSVLVLVGFRDMDSFQGESSSLFAVTRS